MLDVNKNKKYDKINGKSVISWQFQPNNIIIVSLEERGGIQLWKELINQIIVKRQKNMVSLHVKEQRLLTIVVEKVVRN